MKFVAALLFAALSSAWAAPALVWKRSGREAAVVHHSNEIPADRMLESALNVESDNSSSSLKVVFLVGRAEGGAEGLSALTTKGALPGVAAQYEKADAVLHHVSNVQSVHSITRDATRANAGSVLSVSLDEFSSKLESMQKAQAEMEISEKGSVAARTPPKKRARALAEANVLVVDVAADIEPSMLDNAVVRAIDSSLIESVVLSAVRSTDEVKMERDQMSRRRMSVMEERGHRILSSLNNRRLEDAQQGDDADNNNNGGDDDVSGIYYVSMTPNILAGILFTLLFAVITWIGVTCMGSIQGQDTYVSKMPTIGREA